MSKSVEYYENRIFRFGYILVFLLIFIWASKKHGPDIIFFFDQVEGVAKIEFIQKQKIEVIYFHEDLNEVVNLYTKIRSLKDVQKLQAKDNWEIVYSRNFPQRVSIVNIHNKPGLGAFLTLIIYSLPLILYRYSFKEK